jgi:hypothetical protein
MKSQFLNKIAIAAALAMGLAASALTAQANSVDAVLQSAQANDEAAKASQKKVDKLAGEADTILQDYRAVNKQVDGLKVYNARLQKQTDSQQKRIDEFAGSIEQVTIIERQMLPLTIRMIDTLEQFVKLDVPFSEKERADRIAFLRNSVDRSDLSVAEKFRQVLEAYKIESEYGRKIEAYSGSVSVDGVDREVSFLRIGRIALLYQTTDTEVSGYWDQKNRKWEQLDKGAYRSAVLGGLRIARKQASIDIMKTPIQAPEAVN